MSLRILIVDDISFVRLGLRLIVERHKNWTVCGEAQDGLEAIEMAADLEPDLVLLDISMPKMNGLVAAPLIRKKVPRARIVMVTLDPSPELAHAASKAGAEAFVSKSLLASDLTPTIEAIEASAV